MRYRRSGLTTYAGQDKLIQYLFLTWINYFKCRIDISYKSQYFAFISFKWRNQLQCFPYA
jgi:hypothetical protein